MSLLMSLTEDILRTDPMKGGYC